MAGEAAPLARLLGMDSGRGGGEEGREGQGGEEQRREEIWKDGDDKRGMEENQMMEGQKRALSIEEREKANKEGERSNQQEQEKIVMVQQEIGEEEEDIGQGEERKEMVRWEGKELCFQDQIHGKELGKDGKIDSDQSLDQEINAVKIVTLKENEDFFLEGVFDRKTHLADKCQELFKNKDSHLSLYNQDCDNALDIFEIAEEQICKKFQCGVCQQIYESSYVLKVHNVKCHGEDNDTMLSKSLDFTDYIEPSKQRQTLKVFSRSKIQQKIEDLPDWIKLLHKTKNPGHNIEFILSNYGGPQLIVDSYIFITEIRPKQKKDGLHLFWRCNNKKCFLRLQTLDGCIKRKVQPNARRTHNHEAPMHSAARLKIKETLRKKELKSQLPNQEYTLTGSKRKRKRPRTSLPEWHQQAHKIGNPTHNIDFVSSGQGGTLLSLDEYLFTVNKMYPNRIYWTCTDLQCKASVTTVNGIITCSKAHMGFRETESAAVNLHNHEEPVRRFAKLKGREAFKAAVINSPDEHISDIVKQFSQEEKVKGKKSSLKHAALTYKARHMTEHKLAS